MVVFIKGNPLRLTCNLSLEDFKKLSHLHAQGEIHVRLSVSYGERVGFISFDDLDLSRSPTSSEQLDLEL
jgi:hypothetical protein